MLAYLQQLLAGFLGYWTPVSHRLLWAAFNLWLWPAPSCLLGREEI